MEDKFSLSDGIIDKGNANKYISPGIHDVKVIAIKTATSKANKPYIIITVEDKNGAICSHNYSFNTEITPGKQVSAWSITKNALLQLATAVVGIEKAKSTLDAVGFDNFVNKLSATIIGKTLRMKIAGEEAVLTSGKTFVKSFFGTGLFAESINNKPSTLYFDEDRNVKRLPKTETESTVATGNDLPW